MKVLSGREATLLALLAQNPGMPETSKRRVLAQLNGQALNIAKVLVGEEKRASGPVKAAAEGFSSWAKGLSTATG
jgi:hypothetical protein